MPASTDTPQTPASAANSESSSSSTLGSFLSGCLKTPGVKNIEAAYSRAGAANNHTPGAASQLGSQSQEGGGSEHQGVGSQKFKDGISDQRQEPSAIGKIFNNMVNGTDQSK